jgi:Periplasmic protein involved in polysaccharide export
LFANTSSQPLGALAVPSSYVLAAGDELQIQLFGSENSTTNVTVSREGMVDISQIGPVLVAGKSLEETKQFLSKQISEKLIGVEAYISIGSLKAINLRVVGEVINPGNYVLGALSNVTELLSAAGGISDIGSYRSIYVKRASKTVAVIDLYDLLLTGGTSDEIRLISGDTLFVPVAKQRVSVRGEILRPAIYELEANTTLGTLLSLAGLTPNASSKRVLIERTDVNGKRLIEGRRNSK